MTDKREDDAYDELTKLLLEAECYEHQFTAAWREVDTPRLESFLPEPQSAGYEFVLLSLMEIEQRERVRRGKPIRRDDWVRRFPTSAEIIQDHWPAISTSLQGLQETASAPEPESDRDSKGVVRTLGGRKLFERIGEGRTSLVYRCNSRDGEGAAVMQVLRPEFLARFSPDDREQWASQWKGVQLKARSAKVHGLVGVHEVDQELDFVFVSLEAMTGSAGEVFIRRAPSPSSITRQLLAAIEALQSAHAAGFYHGALRPTKLFLANDGRLKIGGYGFVKAFESMPAAWRSALQGIRGCVAPELLRDPSALAPACDVFSLGVMLYQGLSVRRPFGDLDAASEMGAFPPAQPIPLRRLNPEVGRGLENVAKRCLQIRPSERFSSLAELRDELAQAAQEQGKLAVPKGKGGGFWLRIFGR